jgi:hypothetical protein
MPAASTAMSILYSLAISFDGESFADAKSALDHAMSGNVLIAAASQAHNVATTLLVNDQVLGTSNDYHQWKGIGAEEASVCRFFGPAAAGLERR